MNEAKKRARVRGVSIDDACYPPHAACEAKHPQLIWKRERFSVATVILK